MCSSQDSKYFLPPTPMGAGDFSVPLTYQSNKEPTTDVGNQAPIPDPTQFQPPAPMPGPMPVLGSGPGAFPGRSYGGNPFFGGSPIRGRFGFDGGGDYGGPISRFGSFGSRFGAGAGLPTAPISQPTYSGAPAVSSAPIVSKPTMSSPFTSMPNRFNGFGTSFNRRTIFG